MKRIEVGLGDRSYEVAIGAGLLDRAGELLAPHARGGRIVAVSDDNVWAAQGPRMAASGLEIVPVVVPPGEGSKSWAQLEALCERLLELGVDRGDTILAFGGGMVGDLAGFAASVLKRGCAFVQVPTSLLAQVDSSVGGKTAINAAAGKNLIGAFHQPAAVLIDPTTLDTLPERELRAGYAEVVKYGLIGDPGFFDWCEANGAALLAGDPERPAARDRDLRSGQGGDRRRGRAGDERTAGAAQFRPYASAMRSRPRPGFCTARRSRSGWRRRSADRSSGGCARRRTRNGPSRISARSDCRPRPTCRRIGWPSACATTRRAGRGC